MSQSIHIGMLCAKLILEGQFNAHNLAELLQVLPTPALNALPSLPV
jgi:hypothetical protein